MANPNPIEAAHQGIESALRAGVDLRRLVAEIRRARDPRIIASENAARIADVFDEQLAQRRAARDLRDVWPGATVRRDVDCFGGVTWIALGPNGSTILARAEAPEELPALVRASIRVRPGYAISPAVARFEAAE